jgi:hypothetical protein
MRIAVLVTEYLKTYVQKAVAELDLACETEIFIYYNYEHIAELYRLLEDRFDGFITTGLGPLQAIRQSAANCKPLGYFQCSESNYYKTFFEVIYQYQDWNFEYGYFDFCDYLCPDQESSLIPYLKNGTFKEWMDQNNRLIAQRPIDEIQETYRNKIQKHITLWKEGKIKYSLSRMSPIMPQLLEAGVNCYYISPSQNDIRLSFEELTHEIALSQLQKHQPAAIDILLSPGKTADTCDSVESKDQYESLKRLINAYNKKNLCNFILRDTRSGFRISTDHETIKQITDSFTSCLLGDYIRQNSDHQVCIGYGLGDTLGQAEANAENAAKESRFNGGKNSYLINQKNDLIGLFERGQELSILGETTPYIREIADRTGLSTLTVQKLIAALNVTGTEEVTTQELSRILHITVRSVNRVVSVLMRSGLAKALYSKQTGTKGRPSKVYQFYLNL